MLTCPNTGVHSKAYLTIHKSVHELRFVLILALLSISLGASGQYYGMRFLGHEYPLNERSGLDLTPDSPIRIAKKTDLEFYFRLDPGHHSYYGYVFRMLVGNKSIDLIHGVLTGNPNNFELVIGGKTSKIAFPVSLDRLCDEWILLRFEMDFEKGIINGIVDGRRISDTLEGFDYRDRLRLMFGRHSYQNFSSTDVPSMIIRDVRLGTNGQEACHWRLDETEGTTVNSQPEGFRGMALNPDWLLRHHNTWKQLLDLEIKDTVANCYDPTNEDLYIVSMDTVYIYNFKKDSLRKIAHRSPPFLSKPNSVLFNPVTGHLLMYSIDNDYVRRFDPDFGTWSDVEPGQEPLTYYWHHNRFISTEGRITVLGGYGYHLYQSGLKSWNPDRNKFEDVPYSGIFHPRYLAGMGMNPSDSMYYIVGGYGSESGKQSESPDYYYELLKYSTFDSTFSSVHEFKNTNRGFCFANSLYFDEDNNLYGLSYSKYEYDNKLQLVKIPLSNPEIIELGDPIAYKFIDVKSFADLHYSSSQNSLIALSSFSDNGKTSFSAYSIAFPPQIYEGSPEMASKVRETPFWVYYLPVAAIVLGIGYSFYVFFRKKAKPEPQKWKALVVPVKQKRKNAIFLFGGFQVFDKDGEDITGKFTPLLKKLFLYILVHSIWNDKGVSSKALYEAFWSDKPVEKARNNRAVNVVKLRNILENMETPSISKDTGYWKFDFDDSKLFIDYFEYRKIAQHKSQIAREDMVFLLSLIENKPFLNNLEAEWLDPFKSNISDEIIDIFINYIASSKDDSKFLLHLTNCILTFDPISEQALRLRCKLLIEEGKHSLANSTYTRFVNEYKHLYGEEYSQSFNDLVEN